MLSLSAVAVPISLLVHAVLIVVLVKAPVSESCLDEGNKAKPNELLVVELRLASWRRRERTSDHLS